MRSHQILRSQSVNNSGFPIQEWRQISLNTIMFRVDNTPFLNEIDNVNEGVVYIYIKNTGIELLDQKHITHTYVGVNCSDRYFIINFNSPEIVVFSTLPDNGILYLENTETDNPKPNPDPPQTFAITPPDTYKGNIVNTNNKNTIIIWVAVLFFLIFLILSFRK